MKTQRKKEKNWQKKITDNLDGKTKKKKTQY